jgi:NCS2 family nucleobase:cation symporter-2
VQIEASFDEFNLNLRVSYEGPALEFPRTQLTADEILSSEEGERRLAGYLLRMSADQVSVAQKNGHTIMRFDFDH